MGAVSVAVTLGTLALALRCRCIHSNRSRSALPPHVCRAGRGTRPRRIAAVRSSADASELSRGSVCSSADAGKLCVAAFVHLR
jgi:hypothetical protein